MCPKFVSYLSLIKSFSYVCFNLQLTSLKSTCEGCLFIKISRANTAKETLHYHHEFCMRFTFICFAKNSYCVEKFHTFAIRDILILLFTAKTNRKNFYFSDNSLAPQLTRLRTLPRQRQISGKIFLASILLQCCQL